jgi:hypothetical protein
MGKDKPWPTLIDFVTGEKVPDIGSEANRQALEQFLVNEKGFSKTDIEVDADFEIIIADTPHRSQVDLVVSVDSIRYMAIKCAAGSLGSREREIVAAARLLEQNQIPLSIVSDGETAIILDTLSGKKMGEGLNKIPSQKEARARLKQIELQPLPPGRAEKEKLIFRTYDLMNVNVKRNVSVK